ncbi:MAG TPA: proton-conducting transporter membrane subunit [Terricaulis sp.]|nr:proton-conducting transporter membrane subunit [Terricaulis sp.]
MSVLSLASQHAPLLMILAPILGAALAALPMPARASWACAVIAALASAYFAIDLGQRTLLGGAPLAHYGEGVALAPDGFSIFSAALTAGLGALTLLAAGALAKGLNRRTGPLAFALALCVAAGWLGALAARDWFGFVLGVETGWLAGVALAALRGERDRMALSAAMRMLSAGAAASALLLIGVALIGRAIGSWELGALEDARIVTPGLASAGVALTIAALALKAGVAPLHLWAPAAWGRAGALALLVIGVVGMVGALAALMRIGAHGLGAPAIGGGVAAGLAALGALSVLIGSVQAIGAATLPRLAAYAAAAQAGCILISLALGSQAGYAAALVQLLALAAAALALLAGAAAAGGAHMLAALDGLGRRAPLAGLAFTAGALGLMGAPLTIGFLGRWRMIEAAVGVGWWWAAVAAIAASLAGVFYGGRLIERVYFRRANTTIEAPPRWGFAFAPALVAAIAATLWGVEPSLLLDSAGAAASLMLGAAP